MIAIATEDYTLDENGYYQFSADLDVSELKCPNCNERVMARHSYYSRSFNYNNQYKKIRILRVRCKKCRKTHALMPLFLIPYQHETIENQADKILTILDKKNNELDEYEYKKSKRIIKKWMDLCNMLNLVNGFEFVKLNIEINEVNKKCYFQMHKGNYYVQCIIHISGPNNDSLIKI